MPQVRPVRQSRQLPDQTMRFLSAMRRMRIRDRHCHKNTFGYSSDYAAQFTRDIIKYYYGLAEEDDLITGTADTLDNAVSNEM